MKIIIENYTFDASARTIEFDDYVAIALENVLLVTNVTDNIIIYNFAGLGMGGAVATNVLTLDFNTTGMDDTDTLQIIYDDPAISLATEATLNALNTKVATCNTGAVTVASSALPTGAATSAKQDTVIGHVDGIETLLGTIDADTGSIATSASTLAGAVSGTEVQVDVVTMPTTTVQATDLDIRALVNTDVVTAELSATDNAVLDAIETAVEAIQAAQLPDGHNVTVDNASIAVTGTFWQATQPVSAASLPLPTGASTAANQSTIIGHVDGIESAIASTNTKLDTVITNTDAALTDAELRASAVPVSLASVPSHAVTNAGTFAVQVTSAPSTTVTATDLDIRNLSQSQDSVLVYGSDDGGTTKRVLKTNAAGELTFSDAALNIAEYGGVAVGAGNGFYVRPGTGVNLDTGAVVVSSSVLPTGAATSANQSTIIGHVDGIETAIASTNTKLDTIITNTDAALTDTELRASPVPVSASSLPLPTGAATAANQSTIIGHVDGIETLLGTIDADTGAIATSAASIDGKITACNTGAVVVSSSALPTGAATEATLSTLNGKVTACNTGAVTISAALPAGANNIGDVDVASIAAGTNYIGKVRPTDGTTDAEIVPLAGYNAQAVAIVDGSGSQITSFGGGTQYTEGDTDSSITGTAVMWEDTSDTLRPVSAAKPLPVNVTNSGVAVAGDVAHAATDSGNPVKVGGKAKNYGSLPTAVTDGNRANFLTDRYGSQFVQLGSPYVRAYSAEYSTAQTNTAILIAGSGEAIRVYGYVINLDYDCTVVVEATLGFAATSLGANDGIIFKTKGMIPGTITMPLPAPVCGASGEDLRITCTEPTGANLNVTIFYDIIAI